MQIIVNLNVLLRLHLLHLLNVQEHNTNKNQGLAHRSSRAWTRYRSRRRRRTWRWCRSGTRRSRRRRSGTRRSRRRRWWWCRSGTRRSRALWKTTINSQGSSTEFLTTCANDS
jgi:hypothetical protein